MSIHDRLKRVVRYLIGQGFAENQEGIGRLIGYTNKASFSHILNNQKPLPSDFVERLWSIDKKVNKVWLLTGNGGDMLIEDKQSKDQNNIYTVDINKQGLNSGKDEVKQPGKAEYNTFVNHDYAPSNNPRSSIYTLKKFLRDYASGAGTDNIDKELLNRDIKELSDLELDVVARILKTDTNDLKFGIHMINTQEKKGKMVPIIGTAASAGTTMVELSGSREGWINVGDMLRDSEAAFYVYGNSMIPGYPPGSLLGLIRRYDSFIEPGSIYVVQTRTNRYVKRLYYNNDKTAFLCLSDNHIKHEDGPLKDQYFYPPFEIKLEEVVSIWDVTGLVKRNKSIMVM